ncbi:hypothetical protein [Lactococcus ileimucosae]|uniref:hypothetical protein n=1 Tax=Lactococcus ileimucosae TaxID=2941329 RepID=UPI0020448172|nr:hypothetical protein [Lactococcus ileimucosae]
MKRYYTDKELQEFRETILGFEDSKNREKIFRLDQMKKDQKIAKQVAKRAFETYSDYNYRDLAAEEVAEYTEELVSYYYALTLLPLDKMDMASFTAVASLTFAELLNDTEIQKVTDSIQLGIHIVMMLKELGFAKNISDDETAFKSMVDTFITMHNDLMSVRDSLSKGRFEEDYGSYLEEDEEAQYHEMIFHTPRAVIHHASTKVLIEEFDITDPREQFVIFSSLSRIMEDLMNPDAFFSPLEVLKHEYTSMYALRLGFETAAQRLLLVIKLLESWMKRLNFPVKFAMKDLVEAFNQSVNQWTMNYNLEHQTKKLSPISITYKPYGKSRSVFRPESKEVLEYFSKNVVEAIETEDAAPFQTKSTRKRRFVPATAEKHQLLVARYLEEGVPNYQDKDMEERVKQILPVFIFEWYAKYMLPVSQMTGNSFAEYILEEFASKERYAIIDYMSIFTTLIGYAAWLAEVGVVQEEIASAIINKVSDVEAVANDRRERLVFGDK